MTREPEPTVPSLGRVLLTALLLLVGTAVVLGLLVVIIATQVPGEFLS